MSPDGLTPAREIPLDKPTHYYTVSWSPDSKKLLFSDTNLKVWVLDVASGAARIVGNDPWMVPQRTLNPTWSPDSKWVAYSSRLRSMYHAIFVSNAETGESKQITDGLSDAIWPVWDANGKYLWFLASTDYGLRSQWLDMTSYDRETNYGLYLAVLNKTESTPLLPESDEDKGIPAPGARPTASPAADAPADAPGPDAARRPRGPVTVQIDFDGLEKRIVSVPGVPERQYSSLTAGADGTVFYLEAGPPGQGPGGGGSSLHRYRLSDRRAIPFASGVAAFTVSADGKKLVYRAGAPAADKALVDKAVLRQRRHSSSSMLIGQPLLSRTQAGLATACGCISTRRPSTNKCLTRGGAINVIICTCPTCTALTGRR